MGLLLLAKLSPKALRHFHLCSMYNSAQLVLLACPWDDHHVHQHEDRHEHCLFHISQLSWKILMKRIFRGLKICPHVLDISYHVGQPPQCGVVCLMWYAVFLDYMCLVIKYVIVGVTWHGMKLVKCRRWLIVAACNACLLARCWNRRLLDHLGCCFQPQQPPPNWDSAMSWRLRPGLRPPHPQTSCHNPPSPLHTHWQSYFSPVN